MKTMHHYMMSLLLTAAVLLGLTACNCDDPHEGEHGVAIALDNSRCSGVAIAQVKLCVYDAGGALCATYDYKGAQTVASALLPIETGHYTVAAIVNADTEPAETASLTALHEWVAAQANIDSDLLSGVAEADVAAAGVTRVTVPLQQGTFSLPTLRLQLTLPDTGMPDYSPMRMSTRAAEAGYTLRCVAELCKSGSDEVVLHKALTPTLQGDTYVVELQASEGSYDLRLWTDYARTEAPLADTYYRTQSLKEVTILTSPYTANTDAKDAAYGNAGITVPDGGTTVAMDLQRPLAKYRIIVDADEVAEYLRMRAIHPAGFPALEDLTVSVQYEGYFPSAFNVSTQKPNDAVVGIGYTRSLADDAGTVGELELASDWIFVNGTASFVNATVTVSDSSGNVVCRIPGVQIDYRRNELTTVKGRFLTSGANSGGIRIDTDWDGVYDVWF